MESGLSLEAVTEGGLPVEVRAVLARLGATPEAIEQALACGRPASLAADLVLGRGVELSAEDVARRVGLPVAEVVKIWRLLGVRVDDPSVPVFSEADARLTSQLHGVHLKGAGTELLRVLGIAISRVAESAVALYVQTEEPSGCDLAPEEEAAWAASMAEVVEAAIGLGNHLEGLLAHHLRNAVALQRAAQTGVADRALFRLAVGFVDLVGSTGLIQGLTAAELVEIVGKFEETAFDVVTGHGGRVVKYIGDEIMFVVVDPDEACEVARDLVEGFRGRSIEPRGGLAYGDVVTRFGDYYGAVVNVASRLAEVAVPGEVLVEEALVRVVGSRGPRVSFEPAGRRLLKGFDAPQEVSSLTLPTR